MHGGWHLALTEMSSAFRSRTWRRVSVLSAPVVAATICDGVR